jgi:hypothetical protein
MIIVNIAHVRGNGDPTCEDLAHYFYHQHGIEIKLLTYENTEELQFRGLVRNRQLQAVEADWVLFADCDMVYSRTFWPSMKVYIDHNASSMLMHHLGRYSCDRETCDLLIEKYTYPSFVFSSALMCSQMQLRSMRNCGAGYFQLMRKYALDVVCDGVYVEPEKCNDRSWEEAGGQKARTDIRFRKRVQKKKMSVGDLMVNNEILEKRAKKKGVKLEDLPLEDLPIQYHLNHARDNEEGHHIEVQR